MEAAHTPWRSLGEIFVERGVISPSDLEQAMAEQVATDRRLADVLVDRGLVDGHDITSVLLEQLGTPLPDTDASPQSWPEPSLVSTGLTERPEAASDDGPEVPGQTVEVSGLETDRKRELVLVPDHTDGTPAVVADDDLEEAPPEPELTPAASGYFPNAEEAFELLDIAAAPASAPTEIVSEQVVGADSARVPQATSAREAAETELANIGALEKELDEIRAELADLGLRNDRLSSAFDEIRAGLRTRELELSAEITSWQEVGAELERYETRLHELGGTKAAMERELSAARASAETWADRVAELESELHELSGEIARSTEELERYAATHFGASVSGAPAGVPAAVAAQFEAPPAEALSGPEHDFLFFIPNREGYDLVESHGPTPSIGEILPVDDTDFVVVKVGSSPLPSDSRKCFFLAPREPGFE